MVKRERRRGGEEFLHPRAWKRGVASKNPSFLGEKEVTLFLALRNRVTKIRKEKEEVPS